MSTVTVTPSGESEIDWSFLQKYSPKIEQFALNPIRDDFPMNILEGSVRSAKTWALHPKIIYGCAYKVDGWRLMVGQTKETIYTNVLHDLFNIIGSSNYSYNRQSGSLRLMGTDWKVLGARDEGSEKLIRGATAGFIVCDEIVLMPESFFKMMLTRMSPKGARFYGTTNPDNPLHYLKTDYLDNPALRNTLFQMHCTIDDNPNLSEEYKRSLKLLYKGLFYKRFILGLWVMAQGSIWGDCWTDANIFDQPPATLFNTTGHIAHWYSNDYGISHPNVFLEFYDDGDTVWVTREKVWDSKIEMRQKTDGQYADDLEEFMGNDRGAPIIVPLDAASFRAELLRRGIIVLRPSEKEVIEGIKHTSSLMGARKLRVSRQCKRLLRGIETYCWDANKAKRGLDEPVMIDDDEAAALRYGSLKVPASRYSIAA